jgi:GTP-binding protein HflX
MLANVRRQRQLQRVRRQRNQMPIVSIIGYTNAGKSTLLNTLTHSRIRAEARLFATLDPSSRRIRFPQDLEIILTDTVGFIRDLPKELTTAFRATLEELESADLLLHVVDISNPQYAMQMRSVNRILTDLDLHTIPTVLVLNKKDRLSTVQYQQMAQKLNGIPVSARKRPTLRPLVEQICDYFHSR